MAIPTKELVKRLKAEEVEVIWLDHGLYELNITSDGFRSISQNKRFELVNNLLRSLYPDSYRVNTFLLNLFTTDEKLVDIVKSL